jgi:hypothetical protein
MAHDALGEGKSHACRRLPVKLWTAILHTKRDARRSQNKAVQDYTAKEGVGRWKALQVVSCQCLRHLCSSDHTGCRWPAGTE